LPQASTPLGCHNNGLSLTNDATGLVKDDWQIGQRLLLLLIITSTSSPAMPSNLENYACIAQSIVAKMHQNWQVPLLGHEW